MAATHILAIGHMNKSHTSLRVAPHDPDTIAQLNAYREESLGKPQLMDYVPMEPANSSFSPDWQTFIAYAAAEADDYEDYLEEIEWIRHGC